MNISRPLSLKYTQTVVARIKTNFNHRRINAALNFLGKIQSKICAKQN